MIYTNARMKKLTFTAESEKPRLDAWLSDKLPKVSRSRIKRLIEESLVVIDDQVAKKPSRAVPAGAKVLVSLPAEPVLPQAESEVEFQIVTTEPGFAIINKPAGLVVHPGSGNLSGTLVNGLLAKYPALARVGDDKSRPGIVHRLDKETSGVMVVARNQKMFAHLKKQFQKRQVQKSYLAVLSGDLESDQGTIEGKIRRSKHTPIKRELVDEGEGKPSLTRFVVLSRKDGQTLVEASPKTGRMHQLRVHFASLGHPIVGDTLYGPRKQSGPMKLHAQSLKFKNIDGTWRQYEIKPPNNFF